MKKLIMASIVILLFLIPSGGWSETGESSVLEGRVRFEPYLESPHYEIDGVALQTSLDLENLEGYYIMASGQYLEDPSIFMRKRLWIEDFDIVNKHEMLQTALQPKILLKADRLTAEVDGEQVELEVPPVIIDGHLMVPLRFLGETFGAQVKWDNEKNAAVLFLEDSFVEFIIGDSKANINELQENASAIERVIELDMPPMVSSGRTLIPFEFITHHITYKTLWDTDEGTAYINFHKFVEEDFIEE